MRIARRSLWVFGKIILLLICLLVPANRPAAQEKVGIGAPRVGQKAPDFTLPDATGKLIRLSDLLASPAADAGQANRKTRWLVLIFYRGYW
jgi:hypothetical protein